MKDRLEEHKKLIRRHITLLTNRVDHLEGYEETFNERAYLVMVVPKILDIKERIKSLKTRV